MSLDVKNIGAGDTGSSQNGRVVIRTGRGAKIKQTLNRGLQQYSIAKFDSEGPVISNRFDDLYYYDGDGGGGGGGESSLLTDLAYVWHLEDLTEEIESKDLTNNNAATFVEGKFDNAANFVAASNQYLSATNVGGDNFSISLWFKLSSLPVSQYVIANRTGGINQPFFLAYEFAEGVYRFNILCGFYASKYITYPIDTDVWTHLVVTSYADEFAIYVNNSKSTEVGYYDEGFITEDDTIFTLSQNANTFDGTIDEVLFWNKILTDDEVAELYNSGDGLVYPFT